MEGIKLSTRAVVPTEEVYKLGNYTLKLERPGPQGALSSNQEEANSLMLTGDLPQTLAFDYIGNVTIEV